MCPLSKMCIQQMCRHLSPEDSIVSSLHEALHMAANVLKSLQLNVLIAMEKPKMIYVKCSIA